MSAHLLRYLGLFVALATAALAHGIPTPVPNGPLHVRGGVLVDSGGQVIPLRGAQMPGLNFANPSANQKQTIAAMNATGFGILRLRWNFNTVRLPVSSAVWRRDGQSYQDRVANVVRTANDAGLIAVLSDFEDSSSGNSAETGLPNSDTVAFWKAWAARFKDAPMVIFDIFNEPSVRNVPGQVAGQRLESDWRFWRNGGAGSNGQTFVGMQALVDAVRSTGATQVIAASTFHDNLDFQGFTPDFFLGDPNIIYEVHPYFDHALTDQDRDRNFGMLTNAVPVYAGAWGLDLNEDTPACRSVPPNPQQAVDLLFQTLAYFDRRAISWTAASFDSGSLAQDMSAFEPTTLDSAWICGVLTNPQPGMGQVVLLWLTGDPTGFGVIAADQVASAAGGPAGPVAPGEIVKFFGFLFGPPADVGAVFDADRRLPNSLGGIRLLFDGEPAPLFAIGPFQITAQVPYSVDGKNQVSVQLFYQQIPSNTITLPVVPVAPRIVTALGSNEALALNQDGTPNALSNPASAGSVVALFVTGHGQTSPAGETGKAAQAPYASPSAQVSVTIAAASADVLYSAEAPGLVGLLQVNARVPAVVAVNSRARVVVKVGDQSSLDGVTIWTR